MGISHFPDKSIVISGISNALLPSKDVMEVNERQTRQCLKTQVLCLEFRTDYSSPLNNAITSHPTSVSFFRICSLSKGLNRSPAL